METSAKASLTPSLRVCDPNHTHSLVSFQWSGLSDQRALQLTESCLQIQKWCPYKARGVVPEPVCANKVEELMNRHGEKEWLTSVPILCRITLQNSPYMDHKLLVLMSFEVTTVTSMDSQEPACCDDGHLLAS